MKTTALMLVAACTSLGLSGCGSDSDASMDQASADVVAQVDGVCAELRDAFDARGDFPVDDFDPERPTRDALPVVGEYFASANVATEKALESLRDLVAPEGLRAQLDDLIAAMETQLASAKQQVAAARNRDVAGFTTTLEAAAVTMENVDDAANALGAERCGL